MASSFWEALSKFDGDFSRLNDREKELSKIRADLEIRLQTILRKDITGEQNKNSEIHQSSTALLKALADSMSKWSDAFKALSPMKALSEQYSDKVIFLVFGKVNAGKSSFCNFISEQFVETGQPVQRFYVENGRVVFTNEAFVEGVTETTARIQGVELGGRCVLLDSPGLHSVTDANEAVTRSYTDSADAVLWLTPSTSPGQVQELLDLKSEIEKKKPVLPVITRSDEIEEDEIDGKIVAILKNKTPERRLGQEEDVQKRLSDGGFAAIARIPLSVSVHTYRKESSSLEESGLANLYKNLVDIVDEARAYKGKKATQQMVNFLDNNITKSLNHDIRPAVDALIQESQNLRDTVNTQEKRMTERLVNKVSSEIPFIVKRHTESRDRNGVAKEVEQLVTSEVNKLLADVLKEYVSKLENVSMSFNKDSIEDFDDVTIRFQQSSGAIGKSVSSTAGAAAGTGLGGALGSIFPVVGTAIGATVGGIIGGWLGGIAGDAFVERHECEEVVGTSSDKLITSLNKEIQKMAPELVAAGIKIVREMLIPIDNAVSEVQIALEDFSAELSKVKVAL